MRPIGVKQWQTVIKCGADAGAILSGCNLNNKGLRLRVSEAQPRGIFGPIAGPFVILDAGDNKHSAALLPLVGMETDAAEVTAAIRRDQPGCVSVANSNVLSPEPPA
jgi:hypothetical protein